MKTCKILSMKTRYIAVIAQTSDKQTELDFQMNANKSYPIIVKPTIIVRICGHGELMTSLSNMLLDQLYAVKNCNT